MLAAALLTNAGGLAAAEEYPSRIIKLVVAAPARGGIDIVARLIERVMLQVPTLDTPEELCRDRQEPASKDTAWQESST